MKIKAALILILVSVAIGLSVLMISFLPEVVIIKSRHLFKLNKSEIYSHLSKVESWKTALINVPDSTLRFLDIKQNKTLTGFKWFSEKTGDGAFQIKLINQDSIVYEMITDNNQFREKGVFYFKEHHQHTHVIWVDSLDISTSLFSRISAKDAAFGKRLENANLETLKKIEKQIINAKNR